MVIKYDFGVAPFVDDSKKQEVTTPYPATLAGVNYTKNPDLWGFFPSFSIWKGKVMNGETFEDPGIVDKLHQSFQLGLHSSAGIPKDTIPLDNGHSSYKDIPQGSLGYVVDTAVVNGNEIIDIVQGNEQPRKSPDDTRVLMLKLALLPSGLNAIASGSAPSISISMDVIGENVILRQPGLVTRPADNWIPKLVAFEEMEKIMPEDKEKSKLFMDSNSPVMQAWLEVLSKLDDTQGQELLDKVLAMTSGTPAEKTETPAPTFAVESALTKEDVNKMITDAMASLTTQPVATVPEPTIGMTTARFECADLPFELGEKIELKCKDFDETKAKEYVNVFKASYKQPKLGNDLPEPVMDINKVPASVMQWK